MTITDRHPLLHVLLADPKAPPLFKLIGRNAVMFETFAGPHPVMGTQIVEGITLDGRYLTNAREADVQRFN